MKQPQDTMPIALRLLDWLIRLVGLVFAAAIGSIAGYMVIGGIGGMLGQLFGFDWFARASPAWGWSIGALIGVSCGVPKLSKPVFKPVDKVKTKNVGKTGRSKQNVHLIRREDLYFHFPGFKKLFKTIGISVLVGLVIGLMTSLYLALILVSVTTSPFVPDGWRPVESVSDMSDHDSGIQSSTTTDDGFGRSFTHPLLGPIILWTTGILVLCGLIAGLCIAFFVAGSGSLDSGFNDSN